MVIVHQIQDIEAQVTDAERQVGSRTMELVPLYRELVEVCGSQRSASREAKRHNLRYSNSGSICKLLRWGDLCEAIRATQNGGAVHVQHPPLHLMVTAVLGDYLWNIAGPQELAALWVSLPPERRTASRFTAAAQAKWPKPGVDPSSNAAVNAKIDKALSGVPKLKPATRIMNLRFYLTGVRKSDYLAQELVQVIEERWGSLAAFQQAVAAKSTSIIK